MCTAAAASAGYRPAVARAGAAGPYLRFATNDYSLDSGLVGRRVKVRVSQRELTATVRGDGYFASRAR